MKKEIKTGDVVPKGYIGVVKLKDRGIYPSKYRDFYGVIDWSVPYSKGSPRTVMIDLYRTYEEAIYGINREIRGYCEIDSIYPVMQVHKKNNYW